jgi:phage host-nuclease inhibitor protein Gam
MTKKLKQNEEKIFQSENEMTSKMENINNIQKTLAQKEKDLVDERARIEASRIESQNNFEKRLEALSVCST